MFKKILAPIDFAHAEKSKAIFEQVKALADADDCELTLLNVVLEIPPYVALDIPTGTQEKTMSQAEFTLTRLAKESGLPPTTKIEIREGNPSNEILRMAEEMEADLIIVASHQPGLADYLLGSVAGKVVRHAKCAVLVLR